MTQFEMAIVAQEYWSNAIAISAIIMTLMSGYLVVAYVAAANMTRAQVTIVNVLYSGLLLFTIASFESFVSKAGHWSNLAHATRSVDAEAPDTFLAYFVTGFLLFCFLASLKFMWDVRHISNVASPPANPDAD